MDCKTNIVSTTARHYPTSVIKCHVNVIIRNVPAVDTAAQTFQAIFVLYCKTDGIQDVKLGDGSAVSVHNWEPRLRLDNLMEESLWIMKPKMFDSGELEFKYKIRRIFSNLMSLRSFPFDFQKLTLTLSSSWQFVSIISNMTRTSSLKTSESDAYFFP